MVFVLAAVGFLLVFLEFYLPGGIMGAAGAIILIASIVVFAIEADSILSILFFLLGEALLLGLLIRFALGRIRRAKGKQTLYLDKDEADFRASSYDKEAIGKEGLAVCDLNPSGHVSVAGVHHQAVSQSGYIEKGKKVRVVQGRGAYLVVQSSK